MYRAVTMKARAETRAARAVAMAEMALQSTMVPPLSVSRGPGTGPVRLARGGPARAQFCALQGTGDRAHPLPLPAGHPCHRLPELHTRRYVSLFGAFALARTVYGSREGQKIHFVPLDNRLQLP